MLFVGILDCGGELVADTFIMAMLIRFWLALELHSEKVSRQELVNSCRLGSQQTCSLDAYLINIPAQSKGCFPAVLINAVCNGPAVLSKEVICSFLLSSCC